ncbi:MAG: hypothetical protein ABIQ35_01505 [Verrucomicrobiota bacterium]
MITIKSLPEDDPSFIAEVEWIIAGCLGEYKPKEVYVVRIRDVFDYKWCYFSGKTLGALGVSNFRDLTLPPFVPNRVLDQDHYDRVLADDDDYELSDAPPLHIRQNSEANFKRFIRRTTNDGTIIWFSSGSGSVGRGSFMAYHVSSNIKFAWHVTFLKKKGWQIQKVRFTSKALVEGLRDLGFNKFKVGLTN